MVAAGILLSRLSGLIRERFFAHYLGTSLAADAYRAAFRVPNMLQNLLGEGVLSASFIPVYARLRAEGRQREASELAEAIFALLALVASVIVALGILCAPLLVSLLVPGFHGEKRALTIALVRIVFPGTGLLVFSAWCLGSAQQPWPLLSLLRLRRNDEHRYHRRADLAGRISRRRARSRSPTPSPGHRSPEPFCSSRCRLLPFIAICARLLGHIDLRSLHVAAVVAAFIPVFISRGVFQISGFVDLRLASFLPKGNVLLTYAQTLYMLPVSLFGMSVSAAELPAMSSAIGTDSEIAATLRSRLSRRLGEDFLLRRSLRRCLSRPRQRGGLHALSHRKIRRAGCVCLSGRPSQAPASDCWRRPWDASIRPPSTLCETRARLCAMPWCASL